MEALCLLCQSEVTDQMGDLSTMQATLRYLRSGSSKKRNLGALALLVMLAAGTPAPAADTIEELLREDEASSQNDALRVDLNALTEAEWEYYFQVGLKKVDTQLDGKLVEHESDWSLGVVYVWIAALAAGFGIAMGAIKAWPSMRRVSRILLVPVPMEDLGRTIAEVDGRKGILWSPGCANFRTPNRGIMPQLGQCGAITAGRYRASCRGMRGGMYVYSAQGGNRQFGDVRGCGD